MLTDGHVTSCATFWLVYFRLVLCATVVLPAIKSCNLCLKLSGAARKVSKIMPNVQKMDVFGKFCAGGFDLVHLPHVIQFLICKISFCCL
ncbi:hypothetical protein GDO78_011388 [Eleutherodactylus coqui]|uniref:Uncharacterized protein n=1 Tax=Eleutherodactylus coqui TaxID=57060 RepID=A0A8J6F8Y2_ELECQ|nr:hypothetical protein GDO78_011388 [Eleutherodactylus coqui]